MKNCAIILARGGSKGIHNKNILEFNGYPLVLWSVMAALEDDVCDRVVVSSDSNRILEICSSVKDARIDLVVRPDCLSGDNSSSDQAILHAIDFCNIKSEERVVFLQPTSPFRYNNLIEKCINKTKTGFSCFSASKHTPLFWEKNDSSFASKKFNARKMRQLYSDQEMYWHDCGNVYSFMAGDFRLSADRHSGQPAIVEADKIQSLQIDDIDDLFICRKLIEKENINIWMKKIVKLLQK